MHPIFSAPRATWFPRLLLTTGLVAAVLAGGTLSSCSKSSDDTPTPALIQPAGLKPSYAPTINDQMLAIIEQFTAFADPPLPVLTARQARMTH